MPGCIQPHSLQSPNPAQFFLPTGIKPEPTRPSVVCPHPPLLVIAHTALRPRSPHAPATQTRVPSLHPPCWCSARLAPPLGMLPLWDFAWLPLARHPSPSLNVTFLKSFTILPIPVSGNSLVYFHPSFDGSCADITLLVRLCDV